MVLSGIIPWSKRGSIFEEVKFSYENSVPGTKVSLLILSLSVLL